MGRIRQRWWWCLTTRNYFLGRGWREEKKNGVFGFGFGRRPFAVEAYGSGSMYNHTLGVDTSDTIFQVSSGEAKAGVAVVRISGACAFPAYRHVTRRKRLPQPRKATLCSLYDNHGSVIDSKVLGLVFPCPNSYTGDDTVEFHVHGNPSIVRELLQTLGSLSSLRPAMPGEFTRRAFENGKLDLLQVEGLADLMESETKAQRIQALDQIKGDTGQFYEKWRDELLSSLAHLEAVIDFGEDEADVEEDIVMGSVIPKLERVKSAISNALSDTKRGEIVRCGVSVAIVGAPNAGKSTLLNALVRRDAAIISEIPGTTRDVIQVNMNIGGYSVILSDTAGIREETDDPIERLGISRSASESKSADFRVLVVDVTEDIDNAQTLVQSVLGDGPSLLVLSKSDKADSQRHVEEAHTRIKQFLSSIGSMSSTVVVVSCKHDEGVNDLLQHLKSAITQLLAPAPVGEKGGKQQQDSDLGHDTAEGTIPIRGGGAVITRARHRTHLQHTLTALQNALAEARDNNDHVIACEELRQAVHELNKILGRVDVEQLLDILFRDFCIGK